jgi:hypothetical protein
MVGSSEFQIQFSGDQFHTVSKGYKEVGKGVALRRISYIVLDGREGKSYDEILGFHLLFPHSMRFAGEGEVTFIARSGTKFIRVTQARSADEPTR